MDNAERFLNAFALIEKECYRIINDAGYKRFYQLINEAAKYSNVVRKYEMVLQQYGDLRNAIVHQRTDDGEVIAIPVDWAVEDIERIAKMLSAPPLVSAYFLKKVHFCESNDKLDVAYNKMKTLDTSKIPISKQGKFLGVLTLEMIIDAIMNNKENYLKLNVEAVYKPNYKVEKVYFIDKNSTLLDVCEIFENALHKGATIIAILITATGSKEEKIEGIITVADLPEIINLIN